MAAPRVTITAINIPRTVSIAITNRRMEDPAIRKLFGGFSVDSGHW
jgi:hypothetical protein